MPLQKPSTTARARSSRLRILINVWASMSFADGNGELDCATAMEKLRR